MSNENFAMSLEDVEGGEQLKDDVDLIVKNLEGIISFNEIGGLLINTYDARYNVNADIVGHENLHIVENAVIDGTTDLNNSVSMQSRLDVIGDVSLNAGLDVVGDVSMGSKLSVSSYAFVGSRLDVIGDVSLNAGLDVVGDVSLNSGLDVVGDVSMGSKLSVSSDAFVGSRLDVNGDVSLNAGLDVIGDVSMGSSLVVQNTITSNDSIVNNTLSIPNKLDISNNTVSVSYTHLTLPTNVAV